MATQLNNLPPSRAQFLDYNGAPLAWGYVYTYVPLSTTAKQTWQDPEQLLPNTNPVQLDGAGSWPIFGTGTYRIIVKDASGNTLSDGETVCGPGTNASAINWQGPYSGNVVESVGEKLDQLLSVEDFGAVQGADCSAAVQLALNQAGYAYFPQGNWVISSQVFPPANTAIFGDSEKSVISSGLTGSPVFGFATTNSVSFRKLSFVGTAAGVVAIESYQTSLSIEQCNFYGTTVEIGEGFAVLLQDLRFAPAAGSVPAGQLILSDTTVNSSQCKDSVINGLIYEGSNAGNSGLPSGFCVEFGGCTRWSVSGLVVNVGSLSSTIDLVNIIGPCNSLNFTGCSFVGGGNGVRIVGANGAPASVGGPPANINISGCSFQGQALAGVYGLGYQYSTGNYNQPKNVSVVGCQFGVGAQVSGPSYGVQMVVVANWLLAANTFYVGPQYVSPGSNPYAISFDDITGTAQSSSNVVVSGNQEMGLAGGFVQSLPGALRLSTDPLFATPLLNALRGNAGGNPPGALSQPTLTSGVGVLNDVGYDCQVILSGAGSAQFSLTPPGGSAHTFTAASALVLTVQVGSTLQWVSGGTPAWYWIGL